VKELLFSLIDDMAEELLPAFEFANPPLLEDAQFSFDIGQNNFSVDHCKSFWKKLRKWSKEVSDWIQDLLKIFKGANDIKETYKEWKKQDKQNNLNFEEFKQYYNHRFRNQPQ
jgi:hypothetical protein